MLVKLVLTTHIEGVSAAGPVRRASQSMPRSLPSRRGDRAAHVHKPYPIGENRLLQLTSADDLARLKPNLRQFSMVLGAVLHAPGALIEHVYFPLSGIVSLLVVIGRENKSRPPSSAGKE